MKSELHNQEETQAMIDRYNDFADKLVIHRNKWFWGSSEYIIYDCGKGLVSIQFNDDYPDTATISGLSVLPSERTMGLGSRLVEFAESEAKKRGKHRINLGAERNSWLVKWYQRIGYRILEPYSEAEFQDERIVYLVKDI